MADKSLRDRLIGAWSLVSYEERPVDGSPSFYPMGHHSKGDHHVHARRLHVGATVQAGPQTLRLRRLVQGVRPRIQGRGHQLHRLYRPLPRR